MGYSCSTAQKRNDSESKGGEKYGESLTGFYGKTKKKPAFVFFKKMIALPARRVIDADSPSKLTTTNEFLRPAEKSATLSDINLIAWETRGSSRRGTLMLFARSMLFGSYVTFSSV